MKKVLENTAKISDFNRKRPENHGIGIAIHYSFYSYVATAVEVSVINGNIQIKEVWTTIDCGLVLNKDNVINQLEGAAIFGISLALFGKITVKEGAVEQHNFFDYQMTRMKDTPKINVDIIEAMNQPATGVGEPGVPVMAPAICNAIFNATGKRIRTLPLFEVDFEI